MLIHDLVVNANLRGVVDALAASPDDVNLLDDLQRSVLFCAIAGFDLHKPSPPSVERNAILKAILSRPELSLYALNAAMDCAQGTTPLILACRLGRLDQVNILLDCPSVLVDARDAAGITPLMHAVRNKNHPIVAALLRNGARVDLLDPLQRSVLEYSRSPEIRAHLENQLRVHRKSRSTPSTRASSPTDLSKFCFPSCVQPSSGTHSDLPPSPAPNLPTLFWQDFHNYLIRLIDSGDVSTLQICLDNLVPSFPVNGVLSSAPSPTPIINKLDAFGFAPIHRAVMSKIPDVAIIDALYYAGADVNLLTSAHQSPLQVLVQHAVPVTPEEIHSVCSLLRHMVRDLQASLRYRDDQHETCLHLAAEHGNCREILESLVQCDDGEVVREFKNKRQLRPIDVAKPEYQDVFGDRPDSMCTVRPLHSKRSLGSISSLSSFTSVSTMASASSEVSQLRLDQDEDSPPQMIAMSLEEALKGSQMLLDEIDLSLLQRTIFYRSSLDLEQDPAMRGIDESLLGTSKAVIAYWNSCRSLIKEELDSIQRGIVKSHLLVARTKREIEQKTREDERELVEAIAVWEEHQAIQERLALRDQARGRAFTAPSRIPESQSDSDSSHRFWKFPRKLPLSGSASPSDAVSSPPHSPPSAQSPENAGKRSSRMANFIKQKLKPTSPSPSKRRPRLNTSISRPQLPRLVLPVLDISANSSSEQDTPPEHDHSKSSMEVSVGHYMKNSSLREYQSAPPTPTDFSRRKPSISAVSARGTIRKAPVVLTRLHTDLLRMEEYARGVHMLAAEFQKEIGRADSMIERCLLRCTQAEEKEYEDEAELERLRTLLLVSLERKVEEMCEALEIVRNWNSLVRSLLRDFRRRLKGGSQTENIVEPAPVAT